MTQNKPSLNRIAFNPIFKATHLIDIRQALLNNDAEYRSYFAIYFFLP